MEKGTIFVGVIAAVALILGVYILETRNAITVTNSDGTKTQTYAGAGADTSYACETHNGVHTCTERKAFNNGSSTIASFLSPSATSSLRVALGSVTTASTSPLQFEWARASVPDATTTSLGIVNTPASTKVMISASTTVSGNIPIAGTDPAYIIPPNTFVNLKYGGNTCVVGATCNALGGYAVVEFKF